MNQRRKSRELALQVLFQDEFTWGLDYKTSLATFEEAFEAEKALFNYAGYLLNGIKNNIEKIDAKIEDSSSHWKVNRMAMIDRNILRIGTFELLFCAEEVPPTVAINEAVELAKLFGSTESKAFVNGILDQIRKSI